MRSRSLLHGSIVSVATPSSSDGVDEAAFSDLVGWQVDEGADGLVPCGPAGRGTGLTPDDCDRLVRICVERATGKAQVVAAAGGDSTGATVEQARAARKAGVDAVLVGPPPIDARTREGLYRHFRAVAAALDVPVVVHDGDCGVGPGLTLDTVERLAQIPNVVGIVDAGADADRVRTTALVMGPGFVQFGGDEASVTFNLAGGKGSLSSLANVVPALCRELQRCCEVKDWARARAIEHRLRPLAAALAREAGPGPVEYALSLVRPAFPTASRAAAAVAPSTMEGIADALADVRAGVHGTPEPEADR